MNCAGKPQGIHALTSDSAAAIPLLKGCAVHALLDCRIGLVGADVNLIERAVIFAAHVMRTLPDRTMNIRILSVVHKRYSFLRGIFAVQDDCTRFSANYTSNIKTYVFTAIPFIFERFINHIEFGRKKENSGENARKSFKNQPICSLMLNLSHFAPCKNCRNMLE